MFIVRRLVEVADEWRVLLLIADGDVRKVYD